MIQTRRTSQPSIIALAAMLTLLTLALMSGCQSLTPAERLAAAEATLDAGVTAVTSAYENGLMDADAFAATSDPIEIAYNNVLLARSDLDRNPSGGEGFDRLIVFILETGQWLLSLAEEYTSA